jgi:hypothetical protein
MRPDDKEFLAEVLQNVEDLPDGLKERLLKLVEEPAETRADAFRRALEESSRD